MTPAVVTTRAALGEALGAVSAPGDTVEATGLVPTMGALHEGHLALIRRAAAENGRTVVSIFVNPTQFNNQADLARYPRELGRDTKLAAMAGADLIFAPAVTEVYPPGFATAVEVAELTSRWEGEARPGHFRGVATVVTILLNLVRPSRAYFGEKDYQQLRLIERLHADLALPGEIVGCPTVRDADGLALSSRNQRLSPEARRQALALPRSLARMRSLAECGEQSAALLEAVGLAELRTEPEVTVDYLAVVDGQTLEPIATLASGALALAAISAGGVRLIDNVALMA
jgi:pantoate--beta-alanine ligase